MCVGLMGGTVQCVCVHVRVCVCVCVCGEDMDTLDRLCVKSRYPEGDPACLEEAKGRRQRSCLGQVSVSCWELLGIGRGLRGGCMEARLARTG